MPSSRFGDGRAIAAVTHLHEQPFFAHSGEVATRNADVGDLLKINANLGRLGGLIKMWLSSDQSFESGSAHALQRKLDSALNQIQALQKQMSDRIQDL